MTHTHTDIRRVFVKKYVAFYGSTYDADVFELHDGYNWNKRTKYYVMVVVIFLDGFNGASQVKIVVRGSVKNLDFMDM